MFMGRPPSRASVTERSRNAAYDFLARNGWPLIWAAVSAASIWLFSKSLFETDGMALLLSISLVSAFWIAVLAISEDNAVRYVLHAGALLMVPFMAIYAIVHALSGMTWLAWVATPVLVVLFWRGFMDIAEGELD